jgi:hypothetical protein
MLQRRQQQQQQQRQRQRRRGRESQRKCIFDSRERGNRVTPGCFLRSTSACTRQAARSDARNNVPILAGKGKIETTSDRGDDGRQQLTDTGATASFMSLLHAGNLADSREGLIRLTSAIKACGVQFMPVSRRLGRRVRPGVTLFAFNFPREGTRLASFSYRSLEPPKRRGTRAYQTTTPPRYRCARAIKHYDYARRGSLSAGFYLLARRDPRARAFARYPSIIRGGIIRVTARSYGFARAAARRNYKIGERASERARERERERERESARGG